MDIANRDSYNIIPGVTHDIPKFGNYYSIRLGLLNQGREQYMKRVGFLLKVKQNHINEYKKHHKNVWPEMCEALKRQGWVNYSLFMRDDGLLFGYFEARDSFQESLFGMELEEINIKWQRMMATYFEIPEGSRPDEMLLELEEVFHID